MSKIIWYCLKGSTKGEAVLTFFETAPEAFDYYEKAKKSDTNYSEFCVSKFEIGGDAEIRIKFKNE